jgi:hypothetical protein
LALPDVQFALDVDEGGELVFPATEFPFGVTRVYVRFSYRGLEDVSEVATVWYRNENVVSSGTLAWDGGKEGDYIIWIDDTQGLGRGQWRWELLALPQSGEGGESTTLGGGAFRIESGAGYVNEGWGITFDPPPSWELASESADSATFSSPDELLALALRVAAEPDEGGEGLTPDLAVFQIDHPEAEVVASEEVTMNGEEALWQQVRYLDQEGGEAFLFVVSALYGGSAYSLWMLGPVDEVETLKTLLVATLHSVRFTTGE